jgi:lycopene cyclase domain-containing protein
LGAGTWLVLHWALLPAAYQYRFWQAYLVHLIPFFAINGVLTALPVVVYNDAENLGVRLGTVPADDLVYSLLLFLMNVTFYEWLRRRSEHRQAQARISGASSSA